ncbi:hypothetical protein D3C71_1795090 [compost metagenome]
MLRIVSSTFSKITPSLSDGEILFIASVAAWIAALVEVEILSAQVDFAPSQIIPDKEAIVFWIPYLICSRLPPMR